MGVFDGKQILNASVTSDKMAEDVFANMPIASSDEVLTNSSAGLKTNLSLVSDGSDMVLYGRDNIELGRVNIAIGNIQNAYYDSSKDEIVIVVVVQGGTDEIRIPADDLIDIYTGKEYIDVNSDNVISLNYELVKGQLIIDGFNTGINISDYYTSAQINSLVSKYLPLEGGTIIGNLTVDGGLKGKINPIYESLSGIDIDTLTTPGFYYMKGSLDERVGTYPRDIHNVGAGMLVLRNGAVTYTQLLIENNYNGREAMYVRSLSTSGSDITPWAKVAIGDYVEKYIDIPENSDLNDYTEPGFYRCAKDEMAETISNLPESYAFSLTVQKTTQENGCCQFFVDYRPYQSGIYFRKYYANYTGGNGTGWSEWQKVVTDGDLSNSLASYLSLSGGKITGNLSVKGSDVLTEVLEGTYASIKELRNEGRLIPGQKYRITDYQTIYRQVATSIVMTGEEEFTIELTAISNSEFHEIAKVVEYPKWEIKYSIENDQKKYQWATPTGKGIIYHMKDEFDNEVGYDFKNIKFRRYKITASSYSPELVGLYAGRSTIATLGLTINSSDYKDLYTFDVNGYDASRNIQIEGVGEVTCGRNFISPYTISWDYGVNLRALNNVVITLQAENSDMYDMIENILDAHCNSATIIARPKEEGMYFQIRKNKISQFYNHSLICANGINNNVLETVTTSIVSTTTFSNNKLVYFDQWKVNCSNRFYGNTTYRSTSSNTVETEFFTHNIIRPGFESQEIRKDTEGEILSINPVCINGEEIATVNQIPDLDHYLPLTGGIITGDLTVSGDNTVSLSATNVSLVGESNAGLNASTVFIGTNENHKSALNIGHSSRTVNINSSKATYNGNEIATINQIPDTSNFIVDGANTGDLTIYGSDSSTLGSSSSLSNIYGSKVTIAAMEEINIGVGVGSSVNIGSGAQKTINVNGGSFLWEGNQIATVNDIPDTSDFLKIGYNDFRSQTLSIEALTFNLNTNIGSTINIGNQASSSVINLLTQKVTIGANRKVILEDNVFTYNGNEVATLANLPDTSSFIKNGTNTSSVLINSNSTVGIGTSGTGTVTFGNSNRPLNINGSSAKFTVGNNSTFLSASISDGVIMSGCGSNMNIINQGEGNIIIGEGANATLIYGNRFDTNVTGGVNIKAATGASLSMANNNIPDARIVWGNLNGTTLGNYYTTTSVNSKTGSLTFNDTGLSIESGTINIGTSGRSSLNIGNSNSGSTVAIKGSSSVSIGSSSGNVTMSAATGINLNTSSSNTVAINTQSGNVTIGNTNGTINLSGATSISSSSLKTPSLPAAQSPGSLWQIAIREGASSEWRYCSLATLKAALNAL